MAIRTTFFDSRQLKVCPFATSLVTIFPNDIFYFALCRAHTRRRCIILYFTKRIQYVCVYSIELILARPKNYS